MPKVLTYVALRNLIKSFDVSLQNDIVVVHNEKLCLAQSGVNVLLANSIFKPLELLMSSKRICHQGAYCVCVHQGAYCVCVHQGLLSDVRPISGVSFALESW